MTLVTLLHEIKARQSEQSHSTTDNCNKPPVWGVMRGGPFHEPRGLARVARCGGGDGGGAIDS